MSNVRPLDFRQLRDSVAVTMTPDEMVQLLYDRALISDLLLTYARTADAQDFEAHAALYAEDGTLSIFGGEPIPQADIARENASKASLFVATQHISSNHQIEIDGDTARSRSYLQATHVADPDADLHWTVGGWYDCTYRRSATGWKFATVEITPVWQSGPPPDWA